MCRVAHGDMRGALLAPCTERPSQVPGRGIDKDAPSLLQSREGDIHLSQVLLAWAALWRRQGRWTVGTRATRPGFDAVTGRRPVGRVLTTRLR